MDAIFLSAVRACMLIILCEAQACQGAVHLVIAV